MKQQLATVNKNQIAKLPVIDYEALQSLLPEERALIEAALQPKVKDVPALDVVTEFVSIITTVYTIAGQTPDQATLAIYSDELYSKLMQSFPAITVDEVRLALKSGVYGEYGEYYGLNVKTFVQFIKGYLATDQRKEARKMFEAKRLAISDRKDLTQEEKDQSNREFVNLLYSHFRKNALISDFIPAFVFDFLQARKMILLTVAQKEAVKDRAKSYYLQLASVSKTAVKLFNLSTSQLMQTNDPEARVVNISKQFAVYDYFFACKEKHKETIFENQKLLK